MNLQTSLVLIQSPIVASTQTTQSESEWEPFLHPALETLPNLSSVKLEDALSKERLADLGTRVGMRDIIRWEPRLVSSCKLALSSIRYGCLYCCRNVIWRNPVLSLCWLLHCMLLLERWLYRRVVLLLRNWRGRVF